MHNKAMDWRLKKPKQSNFDLDLKQRYLEYETQMGKEDKPFHA